MVNWKTQELSTGPLSIAILNYQRKCRHIMIYLPYTIGEMELQMHQRSDSKLGHHLVVVMFRTHLQISRNGKLVELVLGEPSPPLPTSGAAVFFDFVPRTCVHLGIHSNCIQLEYRLCLWWFPRHGPRSASVEVPQRCWYEYPLVSSNMVGWKIPYEWRFSWENHCSK